MLYPMRLSLTPDVVHFRSRRPGPEAIIQDVVTERIPELFSAMPRWWTAASLPLGAGIPDLVVVSYNPQVFALAKVDLTDSQILAYLRAVGSANLETIAERMGASTKRVSRSLAVLVEAAAVLTTSESFTLSPIWRDILPEIITIEVKVSNWQKALEQAARNRIFGHRSFVALPDKVGQRVRSESLFQQLGIGLLGASEDENVRVLRRARRRQPCVWTYYYRLASFVARSSKN